MRTITRVICTGLLAGTLAPPLAAQPLIQAQFGGAGGGFGGGPSGGPVGGFTGGSTGGVTGGVTGGPTGPGGPFGPAPLPPPPPPPPIPTPEPGRDGGAPRITIPSPRVDFDRGVRIPVPSSRPDVPRFLDLFDALKRVAEPGAGTGGVAGGRAADPRLNSWPGVIAVVLPSSLPQAVKDRLLSPANAAFFARCQSPAAEVVAWRAEQDPAGNAERPLRAVLDALPAAARMRIAAMFRRYGEACLRQPDDLADPVLGAFLRDRLGALLRDGEVVCMATLVQPGFVLTARHCLRGPAGSRLDPASLSFERFGVPHETIRLSGRAVRSEFYERQPDLLFDAAELHSDFMLLELAAPVAADPASGRVALRLAAPGLHAPLHIGAFNLYLAEAARMTGGSAGWRTHLRLDDSAPCMVAGQVTPRLLLHACQTEGGASGAPLVSREGDTVLIHGVQSGGFTRLASQPGILAATGIDTLAVPNYAVTPDGEVARVAMLAEGGSR